MQDLTWVGGYIGTPYVVCNCVQLVGKVLSEVYGLTAVGNALSAEPEHTAGSLARCEAIRLKQTHYAETRGFGAEESGDGVVLSSGGRLQHVGIYLEKDGRRWVLHTTKENGAVLESLEAICGKYKLVAFYEWIV